MTSYYDNLPKKRMAAGAIFFDNKDKVLLVKPTYKEHWEIPGGVIELNKSPLAACKRELLEELSLSVDYLGLLCVDYGAATSEKSESLHFVFDGGKLTQNEIDAIRLQDKELSEFQFVAKEVVGKFLSGPIAERVLKAIVVRNSRENPYMEH